MDNLKVKVTAYKDNLIIQTVDKTADKNFVPVGPGKLGSVLMDTKKFLGMSKEAVELSKTMPRGTDAIGDMSTWMATDGRACFSWFGPLYRVLDVKDCVSDRDGIIDIPHVTIENDVPEEAKTLIDSETDTAEANKELNE